MLSHPLHPCSFSISPSALCSPSLTFLLFGLFFSSTSHPQSPSVFSPLFYPSPSLSPSCPGDSIISTVHAVNCTLRVSWGWRYEWGRVGIIVVERGELVAHTSWCLFHVTLTAPSSVLFPPPVLRRAVVPILSPLQHTPTSNRSLLEGCREQNDRLCGALPSYAKGSL